MMHKVERTFIKYGARGEIFNYSIGDISITTATKVAPRLAHDMLESGVTGEALVYDGGSLLYTFDIENMAKQYKPMPNIWRTHDHHNRINQR